MWHVSRWCNLDNETWLPPAGYLFSLIEMNIRRMRIIWLEGFEFAEWIELIGKLLGIYMVERDVGTFFYQSHPELKTNWFYELAVGTQVHPLDAACAERVAPLSIGFWGKFSKNACKAPLFWQSWTDKVSIQRDTWTWWMFVCAKPKCGEEGGFGPPAKATHIFSHSNPPTPQT